MDDVCAACRTEEGVDHECQQCGFAFCGTHAAPTDHRCPAIGDASENDAADAGATAEGRDPGGIERTDPIERARSAVSGAANRVRTAVGASVERGRTSTGGTTGGSEHGAGGIRTLAREGFETAAERTRTGVDNALGRVGGGRSRQRLASIGVVVVLLVATSAMALGASGVVTVGLGGGDSGSTAAPTNELATNGSDATEPVGSSESVNDAILAAINDARSEEGVAELEADGGLERIATNHSEDMAAAESAELDAWDSDRLANRLNATNVSCESIAQTGAWIDPGDETDADALATTTVDRWLDDDGFRQFLLATDNELGAVASADGDDGRVYVSVTACGP